MGSKNDSNYFDMFLDSVTKMHDSMNQFDVSPDNDILVRPKFDEDYANLSELEKFTISDDSTEEDSYDDNFDYKIDEEEHHVTTEDLEVLSWLQIKCVSISSGGLSSDELYSTLITLLISDASDDELQIPLLDVIGYDHLDFLIELVQKRQSIIIAQVSTRSLNLLLFLY